MSGSGLTVMNYELGITNIGGYAGDMMNYELMGLTLNVIARLKEKEGECVKKSER